MVGNSSAVVLVSNAFLIEVVYKFAYNFYNLVPRAVSKNTYIG